jgi:tetratricopeptide (TPR) repeat protein
VRDVVGRRLSRLSGDANRALAVAAVAGQEFELAVVEQASNLDEEHLLAALDEAVAARLVAEITGQTSRYGFAHALVRATLYEELTGARRVALHRRVAEAIEEVHAGHLDDYLPSLAHHFAKAGGTLDETARAVDYAARAGDRALAQLAHDESVAYYRQALELLRVEAGPSDDVRRLELLISLGEAQRQAGDADHRQTLLDAARLAKARGDASALCRSALANTRGSYMSAIGAVDTERVEVFESALDATAPGDSAARAELLAALALELTYSGVRDRRLALSDEAVAVARRLADTATLVRVLARRYLTIMAPNTLDERLALTVELLPLTERLADPMAIGWAWLLRVRVAMEHGDADETEHALTKLEAVAAELGQPTLQWFAHLIRAADLLARGHLEQAEHLAVQGARLAKATAQPDGATMMADQMFMLRWEQDRLADVEDQGRTLLARNPDWPLVRTKMGFLAAVLDRREACATIFESLAVKEFADVPVDVVWGSAMTQLTAMASYLEDRPRANLLYELLLPYENQVVTLSTACYGCVAHHLAVLATTTQRFDQAESHFHAAAQRHSDMGAQPWLARTRLEWARMLLTRRQPGDAERARELLGRALTTARELGLANVERRAVALLGQVS